MSDDQGNATATASVVTGRRATQLRAIAGATLLLAAATAIGADGAVYAINNATLFSVAK